MKHILKLATLDQNSAEFGRRHELVPFTPGRQVGTEPYGPHWVGLTTSMRREDWEAAGSPLWIEVEL